MNGRRVVGGEMLRRAREIAAGTLAPVPLRVAGTVVLLRDAVDAVGGSALEVYLLRRHARMAFAPGMYAFPGGAVEPSDAAPYAESAAVRELAEETGVRITAADLHPCAHWVTPTLESRRYDTHFFLARMPDAQQAQDLSGEADLTRWVRIEDTYELPMFPPTRVVLDGLAGATTVQQALDAVGDFERVRPGWRIDGDVVVLLLPVDDGYPGDDPGDVASAAENAR